MTELKKNYWVILQKAVLFEKADKDKKKLTAMKDIIQVIEKSGKTFSSKNL